MNKQALLHIPDSKFCFPLDKNTLVLRLQMDKSEIIDKVEVVYGCKYTIHEEQKVVLMEEKYQDSLYKCYEIILKLDDVRLAYVFRIWQEGTGYYFSEDGITETYNFKQGYYNFFQMPYINESDIHPMVDWMEHAVFYQIFIERFHKGIEGKDESYINLNWGDKPNPKSFAGGDIPGITKKLDYIKELGVNAIYLTPVFQAISNHKYDISDYMNIDRNFGTNEDFANLVKEAHNRGMKVVLDAVFNHCSDLLPQFQDVIKHGKNSQYYDWFIIHGDYPEKDNLNYEVFAFCTYMPKFNTSNPEVQKFLLNIATHWIKEYDIDGWRLDVSDEISHNFWRKFRDEVKAVKPDCVIIGENWHDANSYLRGDQYDSIMNYSFTKACLDFYVYETFGAKEFAEKLNHLLLRNTHQANRMMMNLLDTHDTDRFYTSVQKNKHKVLSAIATMTMFVGAPCIYYGTEICTEGGYDPDNRRCFDWNESNWDHDFRNKLKNILGLKQKVELQKGDISIGYDEHLCYLSRSYKGNKILLVLNQSGIDVMVSRKATVLLSNGYDDKILTTNGFVIFESREE